VIGYLRREFTLLGGVAVAWSVAARAAVGVPVIGFLNSGSAAEWAHLVAAFKEELSEAGYMDGRNVRSNAVGQRASMFGFPA
jgi:hypothetical protein